MKLQVVLKLRELQKRVSQLHSEDYIETRLTLLEATLEELIACLLEDDK